MVAKRKQHSSKNPAPRPGRAATQPNKIGASTPYDFRGQNLTPYGGPPSTLLEKLGFQELWNKPSASNESPNTSLC